MKKTTLMTLAATLLILALSMAGCQNMANLKRVPSNMEPKLRNNWNDYSVYKRGGGKSTTALLFQIKNDGKIILPSNWMQIKTDEQLANTTIWSTTNSAEILGQNKKLFGYLVYRSPDNVSIQIIDADTVQLFYFYVRTSTSAGR
jgi:uncharacterized lipoprotein NlpE involved in copper resistance